MSLNKQYLIRLHTLFTKATIGEDDKRTLIAAYSDGRTSSSRELTAQEATQLCNYLQAQVGKQDNPADRMRKKVIGILRDMGMELVSGTYKKADMKAIYAYVLKVGYLHKGLNSYTQQELPKLVSQMEQIAAKTEHQYVKNNYNLPNRL